jgi:hypothetical protein
MSAITPGHWRRLLLVILVVCAVLSAGVAAVLVARGGEPGRSAAAHPRPSLLPPGGSTAPLTFTAADGRTIICPTGSAPTVMITEAVFEPALTGGTIMHKGRYRIRLRGTVNNETGAAIDVRKLIASVRGRFWPSASITTARTIGPQSSERVVLDGTYHSDHKGPVRVGTVFEWQWHAAELADCGENGLVEDD